MGQVARAEIPYKFPSFNEYIRVNRGYKGNYTGAKLKSEIERNIAYALKDLPVFARPVVINLTWVEGNMKRDWDNVIYAKKFIVDALVAIGKLSDDGRKYVRGYSDYYAYEKGIWKVIVEIKEIDEEGAYEI